MSKVVKHKIIIFIGILFFSTSVFSASKIDNYACELLINENFKKSPLTDAPNIMQISYDPNNNKLISFLWDGNDVTKMFVAVDFSSSSKELEFWRSGFTYSQKDNVLFELYASDLVAHLYKLYVPGLDYQCSKI